MNGHAKHCPGGRVLSFNELKDFEWIRLGLAVDQLKHTIINAWPLLSIVVFGTRIYFPEPIGWCMTCGAYVSNENMALILHNQPAMPD